MLEVANSPQKEEGLPGSRIVLNSKMVGSSNLELKSLSGLKTGHDKNFRGYSQLFVSQLDPLWIFIIFILPVARVEFVLMVAYAGLMSFFPTVRACWFVWTLVACMLRAYAVATKIRPSLFFNDLDVETA